MSLNDADIPLPKISRKAETENILLLLRCYWLLKLELAEQFKVGEWVTFKFATRFTSIRLVKQEGFCGVTALNLLVQNCLDLS